jgi:glutamate--cysteine ligase
MATAPVDAGVGHKEVVDAPLGVDAAHRFSYESAFSDAPIGPVGLELEAHLVNLIDVGRRVPWHRVESATTDLGELPNGSAISVEPGGQLELSGPPLHDVAAAVSAMRHDSTRARLILAESRLGLAFLGSDPVRPPRRVNPRPRYRAMEQHFLSAGLGDAGRTMMTCTAALQVNVQAGPPPRWAQRFHLAQRIGPTLLAMSASSPWLGGHDTSWRSARQRAWLGLDHTTSAPLAETDDPAAEWARRVLAAPVLFTAASDGSVWPVGRRVTFRDWAAGQVLLDGRSPTLADLRLHLTTVFPPVRPRGYLELRFLDMTPPRWWPALAAISVTALDDPVAADLAAEAVEPVARAWTVAARDGLSDPRLHGAALGLLAAVAPRVPAELGTAVADLAELTESGRSPGDLLVECIDRVGVDAAFEEAAHA